MNPETPPIRGIPRYELKARLEAKKARSLWHFGPKANTKKVANESVEHMLRRIRLESSPEVQ